jgi:hypothetical protein
MSPSVKPANGHGTKIETENGKLGQTGFENY